MERPAAVLIHADSGRFEVRRDVEKALRSHEEPVTFAPSATGNAQVLREARLAQPGRERIILRAPFRVETGCHRNGLDEGRLSGAILADKECDLRVKLDLFERADDRDAE